MAPSGFGAASAILLIGNFGGPGHVMPSTRAAGISTGALRGTNGQAAAIQGLWR
jgi:hypothetical protein